MSKYHYNSFNQKLSTDKVVFEGINEPHPLAEKVHFNWQPDSSIILFFRRKRFTRNALTHHSHDLTADVYED